MGRGRSSKPRRRWPLVIAAVIGLDLAYFGSVALASTGAHAYARTVTSEQRRLESLVAELPLVPSAAAAIDLRRAEGTWRTPLNDAVIRREYEVARVRFDVPDGCSDSCTGWRPGDPTRLHLLATDVDLPVDVCDAQRRRFAEAQLPVDSAGDPAERRALDCTLRVDMGGSSALLKLRHATDGTGLADLEVTGPPTASAGPVPAWLLVGVAIAPLLAFIVATRRWRR